MKEDPPPLPATADRSSPASSGDEEVLPIRKSQRMTLARKQTAIIQLIKGEALDIVAREHQITVAELSEWRDAFMDGGIANLKSRPRDVRDKEISRLKCKVGELTMDNELLHERISRMETPVPFPRRRSKR